MNQQPIELARGPRYGDNFEVMIENLSLDGMGTVSLPALVGPQKQAFQYDIHVRKGLPGDRVKIMVETRKKRVIQARIVEMIEPSRMRIEPRCRHFGRRELPQKGCGGCTFQSLNYRHQLIVKERLVKQEMQQHGVDPGLVFPMIGLDEPWYYRNKMEFSFGTDAQREFSLGLFPKGFRFEVLNLKECFLESKFVSEFLPKFRDWAAELGLEPYRERGQTGFLRTLTIREGKRTGERMIELTTSWAEQVKSRGELIDVSDIVEQYQSFIDSFHQEFTSVYWTQQYVARGEPTRFIEHHLSGSPVLREELHLPGERVLSFEIHPRAFFQPNTLQAEILYAEVLKRTGLLGGDSSGSKRVLDLYCGTGTIGMCMAPFSERVVGIERQPDAVENARQNAAKNKVENIQFFVGDVGKVMREDAFKEAAGEIDLVVVDPPRAGLLPGARAHLKSLRAPRVVYISCNPRTLARDLAELSAADYQIEQIQPVDMFPHTYHVENIAVLTLK